MKRGSLFKVLVMAGIIIYAIFPDPCPGPIDDMILLIAGSIYTIKPGKKE